MREKREIISDRAGAHLEGSSTSIFEEFLNCEIIPKSIRIFFHHLLTNIVKNTICNRFILHLVS